MTMGRIGFLALAGLSICAATPPKGYKPPFTIPKIPAQARRQMSIDSPGTSDWRPTNLSPKKLLAQCDAWLASLRNVSAKTRMGFYLGNGDYGVQEGEIAIVSPRKFRVTYGHPYHERHGISVRRGEAIADGSRLQTHGLNGYSAPMPVTSQRLPKDVLAAWPELAQELIFTDLGSAEHPLSSLYRAAKAAGVHAFCEQRTYAYNGNFVHQYRVMLSGTPVISGKRAKFQEEVLIDAPTGALVKLTQARQFLNNPKSLYQSYWAVMWDRSPGQKFDPHLFDLSTPAPVRTQ